MLPQGQTEAWQVCLSQETARLPCRHRGLEPGAAFSRLAWARLVACVSPVPAMPAVFSCACWPLRLLSRPAQCCCCCSPRRAGLLRVQSRCLVRSVCHEPLLPELALEKHSFLFRDVISPVSGILCAQFFPGSAFHVCDFFWCTVGDSAMPCRMTSSLG